MEKRAKKMGVNTILLDTFSWQGKEFYEALQYEVVGKYENTIDGYAEYFFSKNAHLLHVRTELELKCKKNGAYRKKACQIRTEHVLLTRKAINRYN